MAQGAYRIVLLHMNRFSGAQAEVVFLKKLIIAETAIRFQVVFDPLHLSMINNWEKELIIDH